jgi:ABC-type Fe3+/spermidine/putrescine transport system ATPase subunit
LLSLVRRLRTVPDRADRNHSSAARIDAARTEKGMAVLSEEPILRLEGLTKRFGGHVALGDVTFAVERGEYVALLGPSGSGKTILLRSIAGFEIPDAGKIFLSGREITRANIYERGIGFVFQNFALFPHLSVKDNVAFGLRHGARRLPKDEVLSRVLQAIAMVGLTGLEERGVTQISGGQKQRVALARTLVMQPKLVLLDEPLGALDANLRLRMRAELRHIREQLGIPFLHVTGSETEALAMGDRVIVLDQGRIGQFGRPDEVYNRPATPNVARFLNRYNVFEGALDGEVFASAYGRFGFGVRMASAKSAYAVRYDRLVARRAGSASPAPAIRVNYVASEYLGAAIMHFFETNDGKVVEVEHHLSNGPPSAFSEGEAYDLTWTAEDGIVFG